MEAVDSSYLMGDFTFRRPTYFDDSAQASLFCLVASAQCRAHIMSADQTKRATLRRYLSARSVLYRGKPVVIWFFVCFLCAQCRAHMMSADQTKRASSTDDVMQVPFRKECTISGKARGNLVFVSFWCAHSKQARCKLKRTCVHKERTSG